jgi:hypothetical protein
MAKYAVGFNDALVDYSGFAKTIHDLASSFGLLEFTDLCAVIEGVVLHDRLVMVGPPLPDQFATAITPLTDAGVVVMEPGRSTPVDPPEPRPNKFSGVAAILYRNRLPDFSSTPHESISRSTLTDAWYEAARLAGAERLYKRPALALLRHKSYYAPLGQVQQDHTVCDLVGQYRSLAGTLTAIRNETRLPLAPYLRLDLPPLALLALERSTDPKSVLFAALEVRDEYARLRSALADLRSVLADESSSPQQKMTALRPWIRSWRTLSKYSKWDEHDSISLAHASLDFVDLNTAIDGPALDVFKLSDILRRLVETGTHAYRRWRVRVLHSTARQYLRTPDSQMSQHVRRIYGRGPNADELHQLDLIRVGVRQISGRGSAGGR